MCWVSLFGDIHELKSNHHLLSALFDMQKQDLGVFYRRIKARLDYHDVGLFVLTPA